MSLTLEVSVKLSGWLNAVAPKNIALHTKQQERMCACVVCRCYGRKTERKGMRCGPPQQRGCLVVAGQGPHRPRSTTRTRPWGTHFMVVTLEVLKLRVWLNADAC